MGQSASNESYLTAAEEDVVFAALSNASLPFSTSPARSLLIKELCLKKRVMTNLAIVPLYLVFLHCWKGSRYLLCAVPEENGVGCDKADGRRLRQYSDGTITMTRRQVRRVLVSQTIPQREMPMKALQRLWPTNILSGMIGRSPVMGKQSSPVAINYGTASIA